MNFPFPLFAFTLVSRMTRFPQPAVAYLPYVPWHHDPKVYIIILFRCMQNVQANVCQTLEIANFTRNSGE